MNNDPLGIQALQETIKELQSKLSDLEKVALFGVELYVAEDRIIKLTNISKNTLYALRLDGKLRYIKVNKTVMYMPSRLNEDLEKAGSV